MGKKHDQVIHKILNIGPANIERVYKPANNLKMQIKQWYISVTKMMKIKQKQKSLQLVMVGRNEYYIILHVCFDGYILQ